MKRLKRVVLALSAAFSAIAAVAQPGAIDATFNPGTGANNFIFSTALQADGKVIIGGMFTSYNGTARNRIARLNADGSLDTGFNPGSGADNIINSITVQADGKIIIAGVFSSFNGTGRNRIARLNADGSLDTGFNPGTGANYAIYSTTVQTDGKVIIGGSFTSYNGTGRNGIARLNVDGSLDTGFGPTGAGAFGDYINDLALQADGKIIVVGEFESFNGTVMNNIARLNADGSLDTGFDSGTGVDGWVSAVAVLSDGKIIIGGNIIGYNGSVRWGIARVNADGSLDTSFDTGSGVIDPMVFSLAVQVDGKIIIGGGFFSYNGTSRNNIARLNADGSSDTGFDPGTGSDSEVIDVAVQADGNIIIVGGFTSYDGTARNFVARVLGDGCTQQTYYADSDADSFGDPNVYQSACTQPPGYVLNNADCDDTDPLILGPTQWWIDADGDGWGVPPMVFACTQPVGYVSNDIDCDDTDPLILPNEWCVDVDSDGHGDPNNTIWACDQPLGTVPVGGLCDDCNDDDFSIHPGAPCDDGDPNTDDDVYLSDCSCLGTPCTNIQFEVITDAQGADLEWEVFDDDQTTACFGSNFPANTSCLTETCCLPTGDYSAKLRLQNGASNFAGSYIIREGGNGRIVHNPDGFPGTAAKHGFDGRFAMTMGTDRMVESRCDVSSLTSSDFLIAVSNPLVAAEVVPGGWSVQPANTGYVYWIFDPDGGYDQVFFESLRSTNGVTGGQDARARRLRLNSPQVALYPPPNGVVLNIRVAHRINGVTSAFGPACRFMVNGPATPVWQNHLVDLPGDALHSCGITTSFSTSNTNNRVYAVALAAGANYRFQWTRIAGGPPNVVTITRSSGNTSNNRYMALSSLPSPSWMANWTDPIQPQPGDVWSVRVAHQRFGQSQWSAFGPCCTVTFDAGGSAMIEQPIDQTISFAETAMELWPNPNRDGRVNLVLRGVETKEAVLRITLLDAQGRLAYKRTFANAEPEAVTTLDLAGVAPGLYLVRAFVGEQQFTERLVVE